MEKTPKEWAQQKGHARTAQELQQRHPAKPGEHLLAGLLVHAKWDPDQQVTEAEFDAAWTAFFGACWGRRVPEAEQHDPSQYEVK